MCKWVITLMMEVFLRALGPPLWRAVRWDFLAITLWSLWGRGVDISIRAFPAHGRVLRGLAMVVLAQVARNGAGEWPGGSLVDGPGWHLECYESRS